MGTIVLIPAWISYYLARCKPDTCSSQGMLLMGHDITSACVTQHCVCKKSLYSVRCADKQSPSTTPLLRPQKDALGKGTTSAPPPSYIPPVSERLEGFKLKQFLKSGEEIQGACDSSMHTRGIKHAEIAVVDAPGSDGCFEGCIIDAKQINTYSRIGEALP